MFFRQKRSGNRVYLQIVENTREGSRVKQRVVATLGRVDELQKKGALESLLQSGARFAEAALLIQAHRRGDAPVVTSRRIGPALIFERLWRETGCKKVIDDLLADRFFVFPVERAVFLTVLHRLFAPGSDRAADKWRNDYALDGAEDLELHHLYRAMAWLGEELEESEQENTTTPAARCTKDQVEEALFQHRRDIFTELDLVFFDTTAIYFEGKGGETLGRRGHSKDHRPDLRQMVVGAVLDGQGRPICCELWPGNAADVKSLVPVVDRLRKRFSIGQICIVADRGMISQETLREMEERNWQFILGARLRSNKEVRDKVLGRAGRYREVVIPEKNGKPASPLKVKEVSVEGRRYVVCLNEKQARKDAADRASIVAGLEAQLRKGDKSLVGNKGFRKFLAARNDGFEIDAKKIALEKRYDGKWALRTNTNLDTAEVALKYKQLWMVERIFRSAKSLLETRPVYHRNDATIRGHVFCSFLALVLHKELQERLDAQGHDLEWADVIADLEALQETEVKQDGKRFLLRSEAKGCCGKVFQTVGVALPQTVRQLPTQA